jgi:hypothetical protein
LKLTVFDSVAVYSLIGTFTSPKVMVPFQIERGAMPRRYPNAPPGNPYPGCQAAGEGIYAERALQSAHMRLPV